MCKGPLVEGICQVKITRGGHHGCPYVMEGHHGGDAQP